MKGLQELVSGRVVAAGVGLFVWIAWVVHVGGSCGLVVWAGHVGLWRGCFRADVFGLRDRWGTI